MVSQPNQLLTPGADDSGKGFFIPRADQVPILTTANISASSTATMHTVSAGRVAFLIGCVTSTANFRLLDNDGSTQITFDIGGDAAVFMPLPPKRYESGEAIKVTNSNGGGSMFTNLWLWEQPGPG